MADITITHSRAEGTLLDGSVKGDGVYDIVREHGFRSFRSLGMLGLPRSRDREAQMWRINAAVSALRDAGHEVTVEINEEKRRSFAEAEAERAARAAGRAERFSGYAENAASSSDGRRKAAKRIADGIPFGQPILVGHHSEGRARRDAEAIDRNMRKAIADGERAGYWESRATAAENYEEHRNNPQRTLRRLERLRAELRQQERFHAGVAEEGCVPASRHARRIQDLREEIAYWEEVVEKAKGAGVKIWGPADFAPGDFVLYLGTWHEVARVNPKTLSVAWNLRLPRRPVLTLEDATSHGHFGTHSADYTQVRARCPGEAMRAFLADGKVPGLKSAREASAAAPAEVIRAAQAEAKAAKRKKRSDPKVPKRVMVECGWDATEATLTWLTGRGQPHPAHGPVTITAPEGVQYTEAVWSRTLLDQVAELLAERGYAYRGSWSPQSSRKLVCAIEPVPAEEPVQPELGE